MTPVTPPLPARHHHRQVVIFAVAGKNTLARVAIMMASRGDLLPDATVASRESDRP
jgi:preprotein translocase subunit SecA